MGRTKEQQREYMREYRARHKLIVALPTPEGSVAIDLALNGNEWAVTSANRIRELEEEVRHLKAELAKRPKLGKLTTTVDIGPFDDPDPAKHVVRTSVHSLASQPRGLDPLAADAHAFNSRPFTPAPKR